MDVIIPVHDPERPVETALFSATAAHQGVATRVIVVVHNTALDPTRREALSAQALVLDLHDEIPSPSGPRNVGLEAASAPFVFMLDSDDRLAAGCLARCVEVATRTSADVVLPSIMVGDRFVGSPHSPSRRRGILDPAHHHLFLRSNVPALLRRTMIEERGLRYPVGVATGEDFVVMAELYACTRTAQALNAFYLADTNVGRSASTVAVPTEEQLRATCLVLDAPWVASLTEAQREGLVMRILWINLADAWRQRIARGQSPDGEMYRTVWARAVRCSPTAEGLLSVRDRFALVAGSGVMAGCTQWRLLSLVPTSWRGLFSRHGAMQVQVRSWWVRLRARVLFSLHTSKQRGWHRPASASSRVRR